MKSTGKYKAVTIDGKQRPEHRVIMERRLGRPLRSDEVVHHVNGDRGDNRIRNLRVMSAAKHSQLHHPFGRKMPPMRPDDGRRTAIRGRTKLRTWWDEREALLCFP